ncbi:MAG: citrate transporter, partial [Deltaproteobacteria bacterium]|nr:citrate transporter [Deltaproteobacteria bacterium]
MSTGRNGLFNIEIPAEPSQIEAGRWSLKVTKTSFRPSEFIPLKMLDQGEDSQGIRRFIAWTEVSLSRFQGIAFWMALAVFLAVYIIIAFEILHRTLAAFIGAALILLITHTLGHFHQAFQILTYDQALHAVDWNVIFLLMGMMVIVGVLKKTGVFQWLA